LDLHEQLVLGVRDFGDDVPFRSKLGNIITSKLFLFVHGFSLRDTQTGLRAFSKRSFNLFTTISEDGFDFNSSVLIKFLALGRGLYQIPVSTVYEPGNPSSHFSPIKDSLKIYSVLFSYLFVMLGVFVLEYFSFLLLDFYSGFSAGNFFIAKSVGLVLSFIFLRDFVFKSKKFVVSQFFSYIIIAGVHALLSWFLLSYIHYYFAIPSVFSYLIVYALLFVLFFNIQKRFIF
jgi:hypothetical protein